jgi:glycine/D-amino acid oxidase-like deaminating enzyme
VTDDDTTSFWVADAPRVPAAAALAGPLDLDVAIVGGGFTGLATAHFLRRLDPTLRVGVLEARVVGAGASGRSGGFVMTQFGVSLGYTARLYGADEARAAHRYLERAVDLVGELCATHGIDCDFERRGFLRVATTPGHVARLRREIDLAARLGLTGIEWRDRAALAAEVRSPTYLGAWWEPRGALVNPLKLARGMRRVVEGQGVRIFEHTPVLALEREPGAVVLRTPGGVVRADKVVLATNAYSHLIPAVGRLQMPFFSHALVTEPLTVAQRLAVGWRRRQGIEDARNLVHYYRLTPDDRLLMGGDEVSVGFGADMARDFNQRAFARLERAIGVIFPALAGIGIAARWGGPCSVTLDLAPAIGHAGDERVLYSLGCLGHGVALTHINGETLADLVLGRQTERTEMFFVNRRVVAWPTEPLRFFLARTVLGLAGLEDRWHERGRPRAPAPAPAPERRSTMLEKLSFGFQFQESMGGSYRLIDQGGAARPFGFTATAVAPRLLGFLQHGVTRLEGTLAMPGFAHGVRLEGTLEIDPFLGRALRYDLHFRGDDGRPYRLVGQKRLRPLHLAKSLSLLPATVYDEVGRAIADVQATFDVARDLVPLLRTLRVVRGDGVRARAPRPIRRRAPTSSRRPAASTT